jgi:hypothetical protein
MRPSWNTKLYEAQCHYDPRKLFLNLILSCEGHTDQVAAAHIPNEAAQQYRGPVCNIYSLQNIVATYCTITLSFPTYYLSLPWTYSCGQYRCPVSSLVTIQTIFYQTPDLTTQIKSPGTCYILACMLYQNVGCGICWIERIYLPCQLAPLVSFPALCLWQTAAIL